MYNYTKLSYLVHCIPATMDKLTPQQGNLGSGIANIHDSDYVLSVLMAIFPGGPGLASTRMWILLALRMMVMEVTTGAIRRQIVATSIPTFFAGQMPFLSPNQRCQSTEGTDSDYVLNTSKQLTTAV